MQIYQVDAFAGRVFQGNPAAVVPLTEWLPDTLMQSIAMENNLAETAFFVPADKGFLIRWFTPTVEVDLCGHATLAAGHVLFEHLGHPGGSILFHTLCAGDLQVLRGAEPGRYTLNFPETPPEAVEPDSVDILFEGLHISPAPVLKGPYDYLVVLDSREMLEALRPDFKKLSGAPGRGIVVTAPGEEEGIDFVSRGFFPQSGIDEDPVTGSAHSMLVPYWASRLGKNRLSAIQLSARRGYLDCRMDRGRVYMTGSAHTFLKGEIVIGMGEIAAGKGSEVNGSGNSGEVKGSGKSSEVQGSGKGSEVNGSGNGGEALTLDGAQRLVDEWIRSTGVRYFSELTNMAILAEEVGEVARLMSRLYGDQSFKSSDKGRELGDELADVLWVLLCIANQTGVDLTRALGESFAKKSSRDAARHRENEKLQ